MAEDNPDDKIGELERKLLRVESFIGIWKFSFWLFLALFCLVAGSTLIEIYIVGAGDLAGQSLSHLPPGTPPVPGGEMQKVTFFSKGVNLAIALFMGATLTGTVMTHNRVGDQINEQAQIESQIENEKEKREFRQRIAELEERERDKKISETGSVKPPSNQEFGEVDVQPGDLDLDKEPKQEQVAEQQDPEYSEDSDSDKS